MNRTGERFKTLTGVEFNCFYAQVRLYNRGVLAETEVDHLVLVSQGLFHIRFDKILVIFDNVDFPDHIIADSQAVEDIIKTLESGRYPPVVHGDPSVFPVSLRYDHKPGVNFFIYSGPAGNPPAHSSC